jgi:hypothetical protein
MYARIRILMKEFNRTHMQTRKTVGLGRRFFWGSEEGEGHRPACARQVSDIAGKRLADSAEKGFVAKIGVLQYVRGNWRDRFMLGNK